MRIGNLHRPINLQSVLIWRNFIRIYGSKRVFQLKIYRVEPMSRLCYPISRHFFGNFRPILTTRSGLARQRRGIKFRNRQIFVLKMIRISIRQIRVIFTNEQRLRRLPVRPLRGKMVLNL